MKKLILAFLLSFCVAQSYADMVLKKTDTGITYWESIPTKPGVYPITIYFGGYLEDVSTSEFKKTFVPENSERSIILIPVLPCKCGWQYPWQGVFIGMHFTRWAKLYYLSDGRTYLTGWSAGGDYIVYGALASEITAFASVAGSSGTVTNPAGTVAFAKKGVPGRHYHGDKDTNVPNEYANGYKTAITWYQLNGGNMEFIKIDGGNHASAPLRAYSKAEKLMDWFLKWGTAVGPPPTPRDTLAYMVLDNGVWFRVMKSGLIYKE